MLAALDGEPPMEGLFRRLSHVTDDIEADLQQAEADQAKAESTAETFTGSSPVHMDLITQRIGADCRTAFFWTDQLAYGRRPTAHELTEAGFPKSVWVEGPAGSRNLLLLLHGLGDSAAPFASLAQKMILPETSALALQAPLPLPAGLDGHMWLPSFTDDGELLLPTASSLADIRGRLVHLLTVLEGFGWSSHRIFLFGFSQGGVVALDLALNISRVRLGGVVSVCGHLMSLQEVRPPEPPAAVGSGSKTSGGGTRGSDAGREVSRVQTPILIIAGTHDTQIPLVAARQSFAELRSWMGCDAEVALAEIDGKGHGMISSEAEMRMVMEFLAAHLELHSAALENDPSIIRVH